jgi:hypothetical protein
MRERQYEPDYEIDGPYEGGPWAVAAWAWLWARRGGILILVAFIAGYCGRRFFNLF